MARRRGSAGAGRAILCGMHVAAWREAVQTMTPQQELPETLLERFPERAAAALPPCLAVEISAVSDAR